MPCLMTSPSPQYIGGRTYLFVHGLGFLFGVRLSLKKLFKLAIVQITKYI